jgi:hypothetical protein
MCITFSRLRRKNGRPRFCVFGKNLVTTTVGKIFEFASRLLLLFQMMLMGLIIAFTPDFLDLSSRAACERTQLKYVNLLYKYLTMRYGKNEAVVRMGNGMQARNWISIMLSKLWQLFLSNTNIT